MNVLIIGGNGSIGKIIHHLLLNGNSNINVVIGSRNIRSKSKNQITIDVTKPDSFNVIKENDINLILLCTSDKEDAILKYCISNKIDYLDITKPTNELELSHQFAYGKEISSKIVFSSGWMSGIIGSLINWVEPDLSNVEKVSVFIYYSLKDLSGKSSVDFMAENISKPIKMYRNNKEYLTKYYLKSKSHIYSFNVGKRKTYLFDIPDTFILNKFENIPTIETRTTYNSKFIGWLLHVIQITGVFRLFPLSLKKKMFASNGKGDKTAFEIVLKSKKKAQRISLQNTTGQAQLTAFATLLHIERMLNSNLKDGIYFSHQIHDSRTFIENLLKMESIKIIKNEENLNN
ncbi:MAG: saccharopine dehydrogenase-like NADP-dependent oxidoreductase [Crocinitomix sp.]|jgi:saccharopine dehydrogenase-like NADP-dependent oxidoreductase